MRATRCSGFRRPSFAPHPGPADRWAEALRQLALSSALKALLELVGRGLKIVLALLLFAGADLADPLVLQDGQDADQDHQQPHEEPQHGGSTSDLIRVHHLLP